MMAPALPAQLVAPSTDAAIVARHRESLDAAERAFSKEAQKIGLGPAFAQFGSADAVNLGGAPDAGIVVGAANIADGCRQSATGRKHAELGARPRDRRVQRRSRRHHRQFSSAGISAIEFPVLHDLASCEPVLAVALHRGVEIGTQSPAGAGKWIVKMVSTPGSLSTDTVPP
jgi:hypothetical protein